MPPLADFVQAAVVVAAAHPDRLPHCLDVANCLLHDGGETDGTVLAAAVLATAGADAGQPFSDGVHAILADWRRGRVWPESDAIALADAVVRLRRRLAGADLEALQEAVSLTTRRWSGPARRLRDMAEEGLARAHKVKAE